MRGGKRRYHSFEDLMGRVQNLPNGCWQWTGALCYGGDASGCYGKASVAGRRDYVHRLSYRHFKGEIPEGLVIDHLCGNRGCVNPDHLEAITNAANVRKGAKLNPEQVIEIRERLAEPLTELRDKFGVHPQTLISAALGETWSDIA